MRVSIERAWNGTLFVSEGGDVFAHSLATFDDAYEAAILRHEERPASRRTKTMTDTCRFDTCDAPAPGPATLCGPCSEEMASLVADVEE